MLRGVRLGWLRRAVAGCSTASVARGAERSPAVGWRRGLRCQWVAGAGLTGVAFGGLSLGAGWVVRADGAAASSVPTFNPAMSRFDQSTFGGRLQQIIVQLDPMKLFVSRAEIDAAVALINAFKEGSRDPSTTDAELWAAKELTECRIHPDTGELTPTLFCFAAYTPMQPPIIVGLLTSSSPATIAFWQWFNQSYNAAVFYANKSVSAPMSNSEIFAAYCAAVTAALSVGMGTRALGKHLLLCSCCLSLAVEYQPCSLGLSRQPDLKRLK